jgi:hypothetical protein
MLQVCSWSEGSDELGSKFLLSYTSLTLPYRKFMRKAFALAIIVTVLAIVAYLTKPSDEECIEKARDEYKASKFPTISGPQKINTQLLAETLEKNFTERLVIEDKLFYKEIYLLQEPKIEIGWGAFGFVNVDVK